MKIVSAEFVRSFYTVDDLPCGYLPEVAFSGRSNVGKSSMINVLLRRKNLAKTSSTPGKTRSLNYYRIDNKLHFVDLPGYGFSKAPKFERAQWGDLVEPYLLKRKNLKGIIQLIDARHDPQKNDLKMMEWLLYYKKPFLLVLTKSDKVSKNDLQLQTDTFGELLHELETSPVVPFSAKTKDGKDFVWDWIRNVVK